MAMMMDDAAPETSRAKGARSEMVAAAVSVPVGGAPPAAAAGDDVPVRSKFEIVPLYIGNLLVGPAGSTVQLKLPGNIGKFNIRAYAVNDRSKFGQNETELVVTKEVNLQALFPRFARTGDQFESGVIVAADSADFDQDVKVTVESLDGSLNLDGALDQTVRVQGTTPVKVRFDMTAAAVGDTKLKFVATAVGADPDAMEDGFDVEPTQDPVTIATSMAIEANAEGKAWGEAVDMPPMLEGTGTLGIAAGVGRFAAVKANSDVIFKDDKAKTNENANLWVSRALMEPILKTYLGGDTGLDLSDVSVALSTLTDDTLGLRWSTRYPPAQRQTPDFNLNAYGIFAAMVGHLQSEGHLANFHAPASNPTLTPKGDNGGWSDASSSDPWGGSITPFFEWAEPTIEPWGMPIEEEWGPMPMPMPMPMPPMQQSRGPARGLLQVGGWASPPPMLTKPSPPSMLTKPEPVRTTVGKLGGEVISSDTLATWQRAASNALTYMVWNAKKYNTDFSSWDSLAEALMLFGLDWKGSSSAPNPSNRWDADVTSTDVGAVLNLQQLAANADKLSTTGQAYYSLAFLLRPEATQKTYPRERELVDRMVTNAQSRMRLQGRTAYIQRSESSTHAAPMEAQALWLAVLSRAAPSDIMTEKLANYVGQGSAPSLWSSSYQTKALAALGLSEYDDASQNTNPDVKLAVMSGATRLLSASFKAPSDPVATSTTSMDDLPRNTQASPTGVIVPKPVNFLAKGRGEVSTALIMDFVPAEISADPIYRGIYVERSVQHINDSGDLLAGGTQMSQGGKFVKVTLQITTPDDLVGVEVADLLPGGLEALDPNLQDSVSGGSDEPFMPTPRGYGGMWLPWTPQPFGPRQTLPDRVKWYANSLPAGTHTVSYEALAVTPGVFLHPPTKASVLAQPELLGLSGGGYFVVTEEEVPVEQEQSYLEARGIPIVESTMPRDCADECADGEACNLRTGTCVAVKELQQVVLAPRAARAAAYASVSDGSMTSQPQSSGSRPFATVTPVADLSVRFLKVFKRFPRKLHLIWVAPKAAEDCESLGYVVRYKPASASEWSEVSADEESAVLTGLSQGTMYNIEVTPTTGGSASAWKPDALRARTLKPRMLP